MKSISIYLNSLLAVLMTFCSTNPNKATTPKPQQSDIVRLTQSIAYFASGCFWCVESIYDHVEGVHEVVSGYSGGKEENPTYEQVSSGHTGHAEAVSVYYDAKIVSYETLVEIFFGSHDPTTYGQFPDFGSQYRSAIFYQTEEEKTIANDYKSKLTLSGKYNKPITTEIVPFTVFWVAEDYHQDFKKRNPEQPYIKSVSVPRLNRFKESFPNLLKKGEE